MVVTVLKTHFSKEKPKEIIYKNFNKTTFENELSNIKNITYENFENIFLKTVKHHAPLKKKIITADNSEWNVSKGTKAST